MYGVKRLHGYGYYVSQMISDRAKVFLPTDNCQGAKFLASLLKDLIPDVEGGFDIIHWNSGLWDVLHFMGNPRPHTSIDLYSECIDKIYISLTSMYPDADIYFATTTVIPEHLQNTRSYRRNSEIIEYNTAACKVLEGRVKAIDDLYSVSLTLGDEYRSEDGLHYSEEGAMMLAEKVCEFLNMNNCLDS